MSHNTGPTRPSHVDSMPYAKEPLKTLYVAQRLLTTLLLVPVWVIMYLPRSRRPRRSWSLKQLIAVRFTRRVYKVTELAGVTWGTRDPNLPCGGSSLKETRFEWAEPVLEDYRSGVIVDAEVPFKQVGMFIWPKVKPPEPASEDVEAGKQLVVGIFLHGGGYCHMSAHENAATSKIPRRLIKDKAFDEIYAVEYRLLQHAPFPAAVQDAAAVYAHILRRYYCLPDDSQSSPSGEEHRQSAASHRNRSDTSGDTLVANASSSTKASARKPCKVILIGDSAGGNLVLALARWIRDEALLPSPDGLLLLSPSCDPSHAFPETPSSYIPRPHASTDYLVDTPEPRALLQRTFLGHHPLEMMHSPYVSPASHKVLRAFYGDVFATSVQDLNIAAFDDEMLENIRQTVTTPSTPFELVPATPPVTPDERGPTSLTHPVMVSPRGLSLFTEFPKACVVLGDAERLEREVLKLISAMEHDGVRVRTIRVEDGPHDVLMMGWWDEQVRDRIWESVEGWVKDVTQAV